MVDIAKVTRFEVPLPEGLTRAERLDIADKIIEYMVERTQSGRDKDNRKFKNYSESYAKSLNFKIAGKSKSQVDLQLSGDMLASISLLKDRKDSLVIGIPNAFPEEQGKAAGNILGTYGNPKPVTAPRDFMGISERQLSKILADYEGK